VRARRGSIPDGLSPLIPLANAGEEAVTDTNWKKEMLDIREMCQALEDALMDNNWDEISIRTKHGKVTWRTDDRAAEIEEEKGDE
jgi:hypothetical protein